MKIGDTLASWLDNTGQKVKEYREAIKSKGSYIGSCKVQYPLTSPWLPIRWSALSIGWEGEKIFSWINRLYSGGGGTHYLFQKAKKDSRVDETSHVNSYSYTPRVKKKV
jgi:hypothetical protein